MQAKPELEPFLDQQILSDMPEVFTDKAFEDNYKRLCDRLNAQTVFPEEMQGMVKSIFEDMSRIREENKTTVELKEEQRRRVEAPYKSSHISHIAALKGNRDGWAEGIRQYDAGTVRNTQNINKKNEM